MKLQHLAVIFIIIVLPLTLILSAYTGMQIDTLTLQNKYDTYLMDATYDGIKAFQINATYNDVSNVSDTLREDVQASISTFMNSLAINMGVGGYNINHMSNYIPAVLFTLYDGYYIYAPEKTESGYEYMLKPYNYYTVRYVNGNKDIVINYTLDNYIVVYGWIGNKYVVKSGYVVSNNRKNEIEQQETIMENVPYKIIGTDAKIYVGVKNTTSDLYNPDYINDARTDYLYPRNDNFYIEPDSAKKYYEEAEVFTDWVIKNLSDIRASDAVRNNESLSEFENEDVYIFKFNTTDNDPEDSESIFAQHKTRVIKTSIQDNLNQAITAYSQGSTASYDYKLPKLEENEWNMVSSNICMLTFMQGVPMGTKYYNNYAIVQSTTNKLYTSSESLYFISADDNYYHKIDCKHLTGKNIQGFSNFDFLLKRVKLSTDNYEYYYRHVNSAGAPLKACYYCIVDNNYESQGEISDLSDTKQKAYYTALAREKYRRYKTTDNLEYEE